MELAVVARYLTEKFGEETQVKSCYQTFPGMSRETWFVFAEQGKAAKKDCNLVIRVNPPSGGGVPVPLEVEWGVYEKLWGSPVPIAKPLWFDKGIDFAEGRAHMVRELVDGQTEVKGVDLPGEEGDRIRKHTAFKHAERLAQLHSLDWEKYGLNEVLPVPSSPSQSMRLEFEIWKKRWEEGKTDPFPIISEALYWLEENLPTDTKRISLTKGNNGLGEEIWRDGEIVAMSDFELAALSDPAQDWAFSQGMLQLHDREETLQHYEEHAGFSISRPTLAFCELWMTFKAIVCLNSTLEGYLDGRDLRPVLANMGLGTSKRMESSLAGVIGMDIQEAAAVMTGRRRKKS